MWRKITPLADGYGDMAERFAALPMSGLKITAKLGKNYAPSIDGAVHLDSLLQYAAMSTTGAPTLDKAAPRIFPIPCKLLWVSGNGLPLWATTDMRPEGESAKSTDYWHKRFPVLPVQRLCKQPNTPTTRGEFKEYRIPMRVVSADSISGYCIGNAEEIERLLSVISFVGKKPAQGRGFVLRWDIQECAVSESEILKNRPVPAEFYGKTGGVIGAWTAPYWFRPWCSAIL